LQDLYDSTNGVHLVCLLADAENISFDRNNTWELIELPKGSQPIGVKRVFKKKDECSRRDREVQGATRCEGIQTKKGNRLR